MSSTTTAAVKNSKKSTTEAGPKKPRGGKKATKNVDEESTDLIPTIVSSNDNSLEDTKIIAASIDASEQSEMDLSRSDEASDDEKNHSDVSVSKPKQKRLTKIEKLQQEVQKLQEQLAKVTKGISELNVSDKKVRSEPRTQPKIVEPCVQFLNFINLLGKKEEKTTYSKKDIEKMIYQYVHENDHLFLSPSERTDFLLEKNIPDYKFNKPFTLDENLKTLFKFMKSVAIERDEDVDDFPEDIAIYRNITAHSDKLFNLPSK